MQNFVAFSEYMNFKFYTKNMTYYCKCTTSGYFKLKYDFIVIFLLKNEKKCLIMLGQNIMIPAIMPFWIKFHEHKSLDKGKPVNIYTLYGVWQELPGCIFPALFIGCVISFFGWCSSQ